MSRSPSLNAITAALARDPLATMSLTAPQTDWLEMGSPADPEADGRPLLWLGANQIGKSFASAAKVLHFLRRTGPYAKRRPGPVRVVVASISKEQMVPLMEKLWNLLPKEEQDGETVPIECPKARFEPEFGFRGKPPRLIFSSGPAKGSSIAFATYRQGSNRIAGATLDLLILDEPPPESLWGEVVLRMLRRAGQIWISMTVTPEAPPQDWLQEKTKAGVVRSMVTPTAREVSGRWVPLLAAFRPVDGSPPFVSRRKLEQSISETTEAERPLRFGAAWSGAKVDRWLSAWGPWCLSEDRPPAGAKLLVAIDHSTAPGRQVAALLACVPGPPDRPQDAKFWVLDEYAPAAGGGPGSNRAAAEGIVAMLERQNLKWEHVDVWLGDRAAIQRTRAQVRADNAGLRRYLCDILKVNPSLFPRIEVPYKASGTVAGGFGEMNSRMVGGRAWKVHPRCKRGIKSVESWNGDRNAKEKDLLDCWRYAMEAALGGKDWHKSKKTNRMHT